VNGVFVESVEGKEGKKPLEVNISLPSEAAVRHCLLLFILLQLLIF
jgi:hypothetical protein